MGKDLIGRVQRLLLSPASEWDAIDKETSDMAAIYKNYVGPLVIASAVAGMIGMIVFGVGFGFGININIRMSPFTALTNAVVTIVLSLAMVYILALIIDALAPTFGAQKNFGQAFKVAAYAPTAGWVGGLLQIIPALGIIGALFGLYSLYLLFVGLPKLMKPAADKGAIYTVAVIVCAIVLAIVVRALTAPMMDRGMFF